MDKNAIKKYAVWARRELISRVSQKALQYGITEDNIVPETATSVNGVVLSDEEIKQRKALIGQINEKSYQQVMEEVAYTWFNRFIALRFMEVNGYLPSHVRVFTDDENNFKPQILTEAINLELDGLDLEKVYALKEANDDESLFKYLIIVQCNALNPILPGMFQKIQDYTELLFPDNLLREGSTIQQMIELIPEEDWQDAVQIIGWLYQYYNSEKKEEVFAALKKNVKITKENIPAATQLFTPDWIVRYMVENSLGRLWAEGHPNDDLKSNWKYYLEEAEQEPDVVAQLEVIRAEYKTINPADIKVIDPCMGSGHILVYCFDVLMQIYEAQGYTQRDAAQSILENNLYGLDIDNRAAQLAYFAVMMKARQYDRRIFSRDIKPHVYAIQESNTVNRNHLPYLGVGLSPIEKNNAINEINGLLNTFVDAKEYGSILNVENYNWALLRQFVAGIDQSQQMTLETIGIEVTQAQLKVLVEIGETMARKYHVVVTNPPYMGSSGMSAGLSKYVKDNYPETSSDMSTVLMEQCCNYSLPIGLISMINIPVWMYLSSYVSFRKKLLEKTTMRNLLYFGRGVFGSDFGTTAFVFSNLYIKRYVGKYKKLFERKVEVEPLDVKEKKFFSNDGVYYNRQESFWKVIGNPYAYNMTTNMQKTFETGTVIDAIAQPRQGMATGNNDIFLRFWYEINREKFCSTSKSVDEFHETQKLYAPYNKGGAYRKWYGNQDYVIKFNKENYDILSKVGNHLPSRQYYFNSCLTWSKVTMGGFSMRYMPNGFVFDVSGCSLFASEELLFPLLGFFNSKIASVYFGFFSPTVNYEVGNIKAMPFILERENDISNTVKNNIFFAKTDWDSFEASWDFIRHPLVPSARDKQEQMDSQFKNSRMEKFGRLSWHYENWERECEDRFNQLKANEEELNRIFIDIYGLQDELTPEVEDKDVTVRKADLQRDIKSLLSYAVGCMFGRYSLDVDGLAYAGGEWDDSKYVTFKADKDGIIPICDDEYFPDDIVGRFVRFIEVVYGKETLDENLRFIADALGGSGQPKDVIRKYFMDDFYADHLKTYQKRPIYWLFDSGKKGGFRALVYMHRYQPDTIARMRTDYVHEQQSRYRTTIEDLEQRIASASGSDLVAFKKKHKKVQEQATEIQEYEEKIHHLADQYIPIDLDDGVKNNYAIFGDVLAKIK